MSEKDSLPRERHREVPALQKDLRLSGTLSRLPGKRRRIFLACTFTIAAHLLVFAALLWPRAQKSLLSPAKPTRMLVTFVNIPKPKQPGPPDDAEKLNAGDPLVAVVSVAPRLPTVTTALPDTSDLLSASQLAGATGVNDEGGGGGGGDCDAAQLVQQALRRDPLVRKAVEQANRLGKAVMLWNGDWVRSGEQDGKGLSAVREAVIWELAFAPEACRNKRMHGTVLLSLADGSTRFAIGSADWRWSDLLGLRGIASGR